MALMESVHCLYVATLTKTSFALKPRFSKSTECDRSWITVNPDVELSLR